MAPQNLNKQNEDKGHSPVGASISHRWMNCPGSVRVIKHMREAGLIEDKPSSYAEEGTAAHYVGEFALKSGWQPRDFTVDMFIKPEVSRWVSREMFEHVQLYTDTVRSVITPNSINFYEKGFDLSWMRPEMWGTNDAGVIRPYEMLYIFDLKYGKGVVVEVEHNEQLMYYALGALGPDNPYQVKQVCMIIVQPRASHSKGPVRFWTITVDELYAWAREKLYPAVLATEAPDAPLNCGKWCRFCPAQGRCSAIGAEMMALSTRQDAFVPIAADQLTPEQMARVLTFAPLVDSYVLEVKAAAKSIMDRGGKVPGFKIVRNKSKRMWKNPNDVVAQLYPVYGDGIYEIKDPELKSVAQMEKTVNHKSEVAELIHKLDTGTTIAPEHDGRAAVQPSLFTDFQNV